MYSQLDTDELDDLFDHAVEIVCQYDWVRSYLLQRRLSLGYARIARLMDPLEKVGIICPAVGA